MDINCRGRFKRTIAPVVFIFRCQKNCLFKHGKWVQSALLCLTASNKAMPQPQQAPHTTECFSIAVASAWHPDNSSCAINAVVKVPCKCGGSVPSPQNQSGFLSPPVFYSIRLVLSPQLQIRRFTLNYNFLHMRKCNSLNCPLCKVKAVNETVLL